MASIFNQVEGPRESRLYLELHRVLTKLEAEIVYTGQRAEWKSPENKFRHAPWNLTGVPTILKFSPDGEVVGRIQDNDILDSRKMEEFLKG